MGSHREGAESVTGPDRMDLIPGYPGYLDQYRPPDYDGSGGNSSGPPPLVYPEEVGERRRAVSGERMVIIPRRPSEEPDYVIPSSAMQQMLQERDRSRRQQEWAGGNSAQSPHSPRVPQLSYPNCHEQYPEQARLLQESEKLSSQEKEKRKIHEVSEYYRKMREETAMRQSEFVMSPLGSQHSPGAMSLGSPGVPSPQNSTTQNSPMMGGLVSPTGGPSGSRQA